MKATYCLVIACACLLAVGCLLAPGCGGGGTTSAGLAGLDLFNAARANLETTDSFKMDAVMTMSFGAGGSFLGFTSDAEEISVPVEVFFEKKGDGSFILMSVMDGEAAGDLFATSLDDPMMSQSGFDEFSGPLVSYSTEEGDYSQDPSGDWYFDERENAQELSAMFEGLSPQNIMGMLDVAERVEVVEETGGVTVYRIYPDPEKYLEEMGFEDLAGGFEEMGLSDEEVEVILDGLMQAVRDTEIYATVDRKLSLLTGLEQHMVIDMAKIFAPWLERLSDEYGDDFISDAFAGDGFRMEDLVYDVNNKATFSEFGKEFGLELPEEAIKAREDRSKGLDLDSLLDSRSYSSHPGSGDALSVCQVNLRTIDSAVMQYSAANDGAYPASVEELVPDYLRKVPECPSGGTYSLESSAYRGRTIPRAVCPNGHTY